MDCPHWNKVLVEWVNCLKLAKPIASPEDLRASEFLGNLQKVINKSKETGQDLLTFVFDLFSKHYPNFSIANKSEIHMSDLPSHDLKAVTSLLMHYTCIYDRRDVLTSPLCHSMSQSSQLILKAFLQKIYPGKVNMESLEATVQNCVGNLNQENGNHWSNQIESFSERNSPLQDLLKTPLTKSGRLQDKDRKIATLTSELEVERDEKLELQGDLKKLSERLKVLERSSQQKSSEIAQLKAEISALESQQSEDRSTQASNNEKLLRVEISSLETYVKKVESQLEQFENERDCGTKRLHLLDDQCKMWKDKFVESEQNLENLSRRSEKQEEELKALRSHCLELSNLVEDYRQSSGNDSSHFECSALVLDNNNVGSLDTSSVVEDLACSVVEVQLREAQNRIEQLVQSHQRELDLERTKFGIEIETVLNDKKEAMEQVNTLLFEKNTIEVELQTSKKFVEEVVREKDDLFQRLMSEKTKLENLYKGLLEEKVRSEELHKSELQIKSTEITSLSEKMEKVQHTLESLQEEKTQVEELYHQECTLRNTKEKELQECKDLITTSQLEKEELTQAYNRQIDSERATSNIKMESILGEKDDALKQVNTLHVEKNRVEVELQNCKELVEEIQREKRDLFQQLTSEKTSLEIINKALQEEKLQSEECHKSELQAKSTEMRSLSEKLEEVQHSLESLQEEKIQVDVLYHQECTLTSAKDKEIQEYKNLITESQLEKEELVQTFNKQIDSVRTKFNIKLESLQSERDDAVKQVNALIVEKNHVEVELQESKAFVEEVQREKGDLFQQLTSEKSDLENLNTVLEEKIRSEELLKSELQAKATELKSLSEKLEEVQHSLESLQEEKIQVDVLYHHECTLTSAKDKEIQEYKNLITESQLEKEELKQNLNKQIDSERTRSNIKLESLQGEKDDAVKQVNTLIAEKNHIEVELQESKAFVEEVQREKRDLFQQLTSEKADLESFNSGLQEEKIQSEELLKAKLQAKSTELKSLSAKLEEVQHSLESLQEEKMQVDLLYQQECTLTSTKNKEIQEYKNLITESQLEKEELVQTFNKQIDSVQTKSNIKLESLQSEKDDAVNQVNTLIAEKNHIEVELQESKAFVEEVQREKRDLFQQLTSEKTDLENLNTGLHEEKIQSEELLKSELQAKSTELKSLSAKLEEFQHSLQEEKMQVDLLYQQECTLTSTKNKEIQEYKNLITESQLEKEELVQTFNKQIDSERTTFNIKLESLQSEKDDALNQVSTLSAEKNHIEVELKKSKEFVKEVQREKCDLLQQLSSERASLENLNKDLQEEKIQSEEMHKSLLQAKSTEIRSLSEKLEEVQHSLGSLQTETMQAEALYNISADTKEREVEEYKKVVAKTQLEKEELKEFYKNQINSERTRSNSEIESIRSEKDALVKQLEQVQECLVKSEAEKEAAGNQMQIILKQRDELVLENRDTKSKFDALLGEGRTVGEELLKTTELMEKLQTEKDDLYQQLISGKSNLETLQMEKDRCEELYESERQANLIKITNLSEKLKEGQDNLKILQKGKQETEALYNISKDTKDREAQEYKDLIAKTQLAKEELEEFYKKQIDSERTKSNSRIESIQSETDVVVKQLEQIQECLVKFEAEKESADDKIQIILKEKDELVLENRDTKSKLDTFLSERRTVGEELLKTRELIDKLQEEKDDLYHQLISEKSSVDSLQLEKDRCEELYQSERQANSIKISNLSEKLEEVKLSLERLQREKIEVEMLYHQERTSASSKQKEVKECMEVITTTQLEKEQLEHFYNKQIESERAKSKNEMESILSEKDELMKQLEQSKALAEKIQGEKDDLCKQLVSDNSNYTRKVEDLQDQKKALHLEIERMSQENEALSKKLEVEDFVTSQVQEKIKILEDTKQDYEITISGLKSVVETNLETITNLKDDKNQLEVKVSELESDNQRLHQQISDLLNASAKKSVIEKENILREFNQTSKEDDLKKQLMSLKKKLVLTEQSKSNVENVLKQIRDEKNKQMDDDHYKTLIEQHNAMKEEYEVKLQERGQELSAHLKTCECQAAKDKHEKKAMIQELQNIREAYGNIMSTNSKLELENVTLKKRLHNSKSELGSLAQVKEEYEKLLEDNNKYMTENDTLKYKRARDKDEFIRLLKKEKEEADGRVNRIAQEFEGKLEKMKAKMVKLYQDEVNKEVQKIKIGQNDMGQLAKTVAELKAKLFEAEEKIHLRDVELQMLKTRSKTDLENFAGQGRESLFSRSSRDSLMPPPLNHVSRNDGAVDRRRAFTLPKSGTLVQEDAFSRRQSQMPPSLGQNLQMEDEEDLFNDKYLTDLKEGRCTLPSAGRDSINSRYSELAWRNSRVPSHLKSCYPAETQFASPERFKEEDMKNGNLEFENSLCKLLPGEKPRRKDFGTTSYKRPGPPTPSKNGGRASLQGNEIHPLKATREVTPKRSTPSRIKALFTGKGNNSRDASEGPTTPSGRSRRLHIFKKQR